jgi:Subtilase family
LPLRLPTLAAVFLLGAAPAHAELVQLDVGGATEGARMVRSAGGVELAHELRIWRVPSYALPELRAAGVVRVVRRERIYATRAVRETAADPMVMSEWWRPVIGADRDQPPGPGKPVTVVDSGLDITHPEFASRANTTLLNQQTTTEDYEEHGTEVTSLIAAPNNGVGIVGVYPEAALRVWDASPFGFLNEGAAIQGIVEAARRGPGVINLSFGGQERSPLLEDAILFAIRSGSLVVAAAGNDGLHGSPPSFPAFYPHVLTAGATSESGRVAGFSSLSSFVDLVAPGVRVPVAEPLLDATSGYTVASGTSFAAPLVAGAAAWVWTERPDLDNTQLFELMRRSATDVGARGFDRASGSGVLSIPAALGFRTPTRDAQEPNERPSEIEPKGLFATGTVPLTGPGHLSAALGARVDRNEDPLDLYRAWAPARATLSAHASGAVAVRILPRLPKEKQAAALAVGSRRPAKWANPAPRGRYVYVEVRPLVRVAEYTLRLTAVRP